MTISNLDNSMKETRTPVRGKIFHKLVFILISVFLFFIMVPGLALAASDDNNSGLGWILFYITLIILIVIIVLWLVTYFIMRGAIKRLEAEGGKLRRYEDRKDRDREHREHEEDRERQRTKRTPKGNCEVCNRKFIPGADAYQCECGKFMHVHCISEMSMCPNCGRDIDKSYGVVRVEDSKGSRGSDSTSRRKINRLLKAKFCPVCNKIIKAGDSAMECDCGAMMHVKCSDKTRRCTKCGK